MERNLDVHDSESLSESIRDPMSPSHCHWQTRSSGPHSSYYDQCSTTKPHPSHCQHQHHTVTTVTPDTPTVTRHSTPHTVAASPSHRLPTQRLLMGPSQRQGECEVGGITGSLGYGALPGVGLGARLVPNIQVGAHCQCPLRPVHLTGRNFSPPLAQLECHPHLVVERGACTRAFESPVAAHQSTRAPSQQHDRRRITGFSEG